MKISTNFFLISLVTALLARPVLAQEVFIFSSPEGAIDFEPVLKIAAAQGYEGWLITEAEQDPKIHDPLKYQTMGLAAIKRMAQNVNLDKAAVA